eukprot:765793-Hanusia_phi.AAC.1
MYLNALTRDSESFGILAPFPARALKLRGGAVTECTRDATSITTHKHIVREKLGLLEVLRPHWEESQVDRRRSWMEGRDLLPNVDNRRLHIFKLSNVQGKGDLEEYGWIAGEEERQSYNTLEVLDHPITLRMLSRCLSSLQSNAADVKSPCYEVAWPDWIPKSLASSLSGCNHTRSMIHQCSRCIPKAQSGLIPDVVKCLAKGNKEVLPVSNES